MVVFVVVVVVVVTIICGCGDGRRHQVGKVGGDRMTVVGISDRLW